MNCPECKSEVIFRTMEAYCSECGLVVDDEPVDMGPQISEDTDGNLSTGTGPKHTWLDPISGTYSLMGTKSERNKYKYRKR